MMKGMVLLIFFKYNMSDNGLPVQWYLSIDKGCDCWRMESGLFAKVQSDTIR